MLRWRRDRLHARGRIGPDEQDGARRMVDDEAGRRPEAARPEPGVVAVAGEDEQIRVGDGVHDHPLRATA